MTTERQGSRYVPGWVPGAVIFDFDGVVVDSETISARTVVGFMAGLGATVRPEEFVDLFGTTGPEHDQKWRDLFRVWLGPEVNLADVEAALDKAVDAAKAGAPLTDGAMECLESAQGAGCRIGLATGKARPSLVVELDRHQIQGYFEAVVTSQEVSRGKPAPDVFLEVARQLDVTPRDCLVVEDSVPGCEAGLAAGMIVVGCPSPVTAGRALPAGVHRVGSVREIQLGGPGSLSAG
ncbi:MAG: HAD family hydrolase [Acidimicrobiales bacterium]